jgi:hypothetical protein
MNWKEILSQIDDYYQVNLFLIKNNTLIFENSILFKSVYYYLTRFNIYRTSASGRRGRKAKASKRRESTTKMKRPEDALDSRVLHCLCGACMRSDTKLVLIHEVPYIFNHVMIQVGPGYVVRQCFYMASIHEGLHKSEMCCRLGCGSQRGPTACARPKSLGRYNNIDDPGGDGFPSINSQLYYKTRLDHV